jgi:hypothetical protein
MKFKEIVAKTDWKMLGEQKVTLYNLASSKSDRVRISDKQKENIEGILSFLDCIQDRAEEILGEEEVFGIAEV